MTWSLNFDKFFVIFLKNVSANKYVSIWVICLKELLHYESATVFVFFTFVQTIHGTFWIFSVLWEFSEILMLSLLLPSLCWNDSKYWCSTNIVRHMFNWIVFINFLCRYPMTGYNKKNLIRLNIHYIFILYL